MYMGVQKTTCNDIYLIECGMHSLKALPVNVSTNIFLKNRKLAKDTAQKHAMILAKSANTQSYCLIQRVLNHQDYALNDTTLHTYLSKHTIFVSMNLNLDSPRIYKKYALNEFKSNKVTHSLPLVKFLV